MRWSSVLEQCVGAVLLRRRRLHIGSHTSTGAAGQCDCDLKLDGRLTSSPSAVLHLPLAMFRAPDGPAYNCSVCYNATTKTQFWGFVNAVGQSLCAVPLC